MSRGKFIEKADGAKCEAVRGGHDPDGEYDARRLLITERFEVDAATRAAMLCAGAMIAAQVGAKATRDALFLSAFGASSLPTMVMASAAVSIGFVILAGRLLAALGPARMVPAAFGASGAILVGLCELVTQAPRAAAVVMYLHVATFGAVLISVFWSLIVERFDPRAAKRRIAWIASAGTLGGVVGGVAADRIAATLDVRGVLLLLAALHLSCAWAVRLLRPAEAAGPGPAWGPSEPRESVARLLREHGFLRSLAVLVCLLSVGVALMDYVFKTQAVAAYGVGVPLLRFFAAFYTGTALLAFVGQIGFSRLALERLGLANTVSTLPLTVTVGGVATFLAPGLGSAMGLRGAEAVLRGGLYRPAYELLYTPLPPREKRATKTFVDVALDRIGEIVGGLTTRLVLATVSQGATSILSGIIAALGLASFFVARSLQRGYVRALERSLLSRAVELDPAEVLDNATRAIALVTQAGRAVGGQRPAGHAPVLGAADALDTGLFLLAPAARKAPPTASSGAPKAGGAVPPGLDPAFARIAELRSGDATRVRQALNRSPLDRHEAAHAIALLAWDEVSGEAAEALCAVAPRLVGQLVDSLLDPSEEFAVRRRVPRVLGSVASQRAVDGLLGGLEDRRFEVRFECARALARMRQESLDLRIGGEAVFAAILRETAVGPELWRGRQLLGRGETTGEWSLVDDRLRARCNRSLEHVFTLLCLVLPSEPLRVAFRGLHTEDEALRGTALEYLESVLPDRVRDALWPFIEPARPPAIPHRSRDEVLEALMRSSSSIELNLVPRASEGGRERD